MVTVSPEAFVSAKSIPYFSFVGRVFERARVTKIYDGDTVTFAVPIGEDGGGASNLRRIRTRLLGVDAVEITGANASDGREARRHLVRALGIGEDPEDRYSEDFFDANVSRANVKCHGFDKYGRVLVELSRAGSDEIVNVSLVDTSPFFTSYMPGRASRG